MTFERKVLTTLKNTKNQIRHLDAQQEANNNKLPKELESTIDDLFERKRKIISSSTINTAYSLIDDTFAREIFIAEQLKTHRVRMLLHNFINFVCDPVRWMIPGLKNACIPRELYTMRRHRNLIDRLQTGDLKQHTDG